MILEKTKRNAINTGRASEVFMIGKLVEESMNKKIYLELVKFLKVFSTFRIEIFCCVSSERTFVDCKWSSWQDDHNYRMILPKPRIRTYADGGVGDLVGFRDMRVKWEGDRMLVQYNICNTNSSGSPGCHYPCFPKLEEEKLDTEETAEFGKLQHADCTESIIHDNSNNYFERLHEGLCTN